MGELHDLTAVEQAAAVRRGELSAIELVEHYLARVDALGRTVGAFVTVTADAARAQAKAVDVARAADPDGLPPLAGVPTAIKDLTMTAGVRTTFGSAAFSDFVPDVDADVVGLLRAAGTISLGKTTTSELGCSLYSEGAVAPPARNPWGLAFTAGGSSGGAAAAVAAGLVPVAQGSDGGGSLRIPAAICGLVGYKPSRGLVSGGPLGFGGFGLPTNGPIARTVADAATLLDAMAVSVPGEPYPSPSAPADGFRAAVRRAEPGRLRIGRFTAPMLAEVPVDSACLGAVDTTAAALVEAGHDVVDVPAPFGPELTPMFETIWYALALSPVPPEREAELLPLTRWLRERGVAIGAAGLMNALAAMQAAVREALRALRQFDLLLSPTLAMPQAAVGWFTETGHPADDFERQKWFSPYCAYYNVTGQPAVSLPVGSTTDGMPVGAMLAGRLGEDETVLATAAQLEQGMAWHERHPAIWRTAPSATVNGV
ncbi:MAG TPA: amidase [Micromonosporaceae bacterium]